MPCPNLQDDFRCGVHTELIPLGFKGCTVYDCFGAGQAVTAEFAGQDWKTSSVAGPMFAAFEERRLEHELRWYVAEALSLPQAAPLYEELRTVTLTRDAVNPLLLRASGLARAGMRGACLRGADLVGKDLRRRRLVGASLRGAALVGADLRGVDLTGADLTGADLRGADLRGTDLSRTLFLLQSQLQSAQGDATTALPASRSRPAHWP